MFCLLLYFIVFFNDTATTEIYTLSLHDALPIWSHRSHGTHHQSAPTRGHPAVTPAARATRARARPPRPARGRSEEHTSELQSRQYLVCRLLLEKKNKTVQRRTVTTKIMMRRSDL